MEPRGYGYLAGLLLMLALSGIAILFNSIRNYLDERYLRKKGTVDFKTKNGKTKGYWVTKDGEKYDKDLKLED
ncbi:hypothetical protein R9C00_08545 [Flammeovirgaceae bacterium SG7u.111]|nr:hypothetical protein [Flammeovirgaceae bacterium SG7u.132]WPO37495.1 hypothetical protein R9C00_08545 [Flammeovirgaceae bacterium SG7u.111]